MMSRFSVSRSILVVALCAMPGLFSQPANSTTQTAAPKPAIAGYPRVVASPLETQIALSREGFSCGSLDGVTGAQTVAALMAFQKREGLRPTGQLDAPTRARLVLREPPLVELTVTTDDIAALQPLSTTWVGKSEQSALAHETLLERIAERTRANPKLIQRLNPALAWSSVLPGAVVIVPSVPRLKPAVPVASLHIQLAARQLQARDADDRVIAHFPVSIARRVEKRPEGELRVTVVIANPDYTFDPALFTESEEARTLGRKLILPPGPNNPVGVAWIGLDRPGYGIHGTPLPEHVGRTESHGCFRLANWDAETLATFAWVGMPVLVDP